MTIKKILLTFLLSIIFYVGYSQVDGPCQESLDNANEEFEHGHFYQIKAILDGCLNRGFTKEQKIQAHFLLTRTFLFLDKPDSAEYHYLEFLKLNPLFKIDEEKDPIDIVYLSEKFTTTPLISLNFRGGTNFNHLTVFNQQYEGYSQNNGQYKPGWGFNLSSGIEVHLSDFFSVEIIPGFHLKQWNYRNELFLDNFTRENGTVVLRGDPLEVHETESSLDLPFYAKYVFDKPVYQPYVLAGVAGHLLLNSVQDIRFIDRNGDTYTPTEVPPYNNLRLRRTLNASLVFGGGMRYMIGQNFVNIELQYLPGLFQGNRTKRYFEKDGVYNALTPWGVPLTDSDFRINTLKLNVGFTKPIYNPRRKDKFTVRNLIDYLKNRNEEK